MEEEIIKHLDEENLISCINALRDVLNEMCCTIDESEPSIEKLIVSRKLDQLIVEYMSLKNRYMSRVKDYL